MEESVFFADAISWDALELFLFFSVAGGVVELVFRAGGAGGDVPEATEELELTSFGGDDGDVVESEPLLLPNILAKRPPEDERERRFPASFLVGLVTS